MAAVEEPLIFANLCCTASVSVLLTVTPGNADYLRKPHVASRDVALQRACRDQRLDANLSWTLST